MDFKLILTVAIALAAVITAFNIHTFLQRATAFLQRATASRSPDGEVPTVPTNTLPLTLPLLVQPIDTKWEYLYATTKWHSEQWRFGIFLNGSLDEPLSSSMRSDSVYDHILSSLGARGWELVSVVPTDEKDECWSFVFKRPFTHSSSIKEQMERCKRQESIPPMG